MRALGLFFSGLITAVTVSAVAHGTKANTFWVKAKATNKVERSRIADIGVSIEGVTQDYVTGLATAKERDALKKLGLLETSFAVDNGTLDFPTEDSNFHNYAEAKAFIDDLAGRFPNLLRVDAIGRSVEGREIFHMRIGTDNLDQKPGVVFMGGHHAREHVSIEMPLLLAKHLLENYATDSEIRRLVDGRDIHIIPMVNPDGAEYDIVDGKYKWWRKNRTTNTNRTYGVDLNRNYGFNWGQGGASADPDSDTFRGPAAFSEPETQAIKGFVERQQNLTTLLTFHTFSELILYPWGYTYDGIENARDRQVFEKMAQTMAQWNGYTPQQSSDLYITSGDTTDWAYGTHGIFAFTFELDPTSMWDGGFYPGQDKIPVVFQKNLKPSLYLIEHAGNPYEVLDSTPQAYGLSSPLIQ